MMQIERLFARTGAKKMIVALQSPRLLSAKQVCNQRRPSDPKCILRGEKASACKPIYRRGQVVIPSRL